MASYRLAIRRDTAANWTSENPTLAQGEFGYEADTGSLKIGDGVTAWTSLGYYTSIAGADLDNLLDVDTTGAIVGDVLKWDGTNWVPALDNTYTDQEVSNHLNVGTATPLQILQWDGADFDWVDSDALTGVVDINDLGDVDTTGVVGGDVLKWNGSAWTPAADDDVDSLVDLTDTVITTPANGEILSYNGANWVNATAPAGYTDADVDTHLNFSTATTGQLLSYDGADYDWIDAPSTYGDADVDTHLNTGTATVGDVLEWDGSDYTWAAPSGGGAPAGPSPTVLLKGDVAVDQDDSLNGYTFTTTGTPTLDTGDKQFGAGSISFPTTSKITTNETINIGTGSWCFEAWMKPASVVGTEYWASKPPVGGNMWFYFNAGVPGVSWNGAGRAMTSTLSTSAWNHIAWVYDAGNTTLKGYFNGVEEFTVTGAANDLGDFVWAFGGTDSGVANSGSWYSGKIDDLRLTVGDPVYTGAFTPVEHPIPVANPLGTDETDVTITSPANGEVLTYNGSNWVNSSGFDGSANKVVLGTQDLGPDAAATTSIAIGSSQYWYAGNTGIMIGHDTQNFGTDNIVIGNSTKLQPGATNAVCIGNNAGDGRASLTSSVLIGHNAGNGSSVDSHANVVIVNSSGSDVQASGAGAVLIESTKARMEYSDTNGWEFTEDIGGTPVTYDLSSLGGGGGGLSNLATGTDSFHLGDGATVGTTALQAAAFGDLSEAGNYSTSIGYDAGNPTQTTSVCVGFKAGDQRAGGTNNTFLGHTSGAYTGLNSRITGVGAATTAQNVGQGATGVGYQALNLNAGQYAVAVGYQAGNSLMPANAIAINATGAPLVPAAAGDVSLETTDAKMKYTAANGWEFTTGVAGTPKTCKINPSAGEYIFPDLPTADPTSAGQLWNDAGTLKVSAG